MSEAHVDTAFLPRSAPNSLLLPLGLKSLPQEGLPHPTRSFKLYPLPSPCAPYCSFIIPQFKMIYLFVNLGLFNVYFPMKL